MRALVVKVVLIMLTLCIGFGAPSAFAEEAERILSYDSNIVVNEDSSITVTETIVVVSAGKKIKRGIFRVFPTEYKDNAGNIFKVAFDVLSVTRDGAPEPYHIRENGAAKAIYFGSSSVFLPKGRHAYTLSYVTDRQIGFFEEYDELYWNVTGSDWEFPILKATCTVQLPAGATVIQESVYTGPQGSKAGNATYTLDRNGDPSFETTRPLAPNEGLTIAVAWPKGFIKAPTTGEEVELYARDNPMLIAAFAGLLVVLLYYVFVWKMVGKDPDKWTIVPLFAPPKGISPAAVRYIMRMGFDNKAFAAAILSMAVKGYLRIREEGKTYSLERKKDSTQGLSPGEKQIANALFRQGRSSFIELKQKNHDRFGKALRGLKQSLKNEYEKVYFFTNTRFFIPGILLSLAVVGAIAASTEGDDNTILAMFLPVWLSFWSIACYALVVSAYRAWRGGNIFQALFMSIFSLPFLGGEILGLFLMTQATSLPTVGCLFALLFINLLFYQLLKAPTFSGRRVMDEIEGFQMFLSVTEEERLNLIHPPEQTPELYEKFLPYALALGVMHKWSEQFSSVLARYSSEQISEGGYSPTWYSGSAWNAAHFSAFSQSFSSEFSSAVSSASSAPGASSGSGGGGFSGGGGGGGGGGGW